MAIEVIIPSLGESITSGIISSWRISEGDFVESGQVIYELETDKVTSEGFAESSGTIQFKAAEGDEVEIGQTVAVIDETATKPAGASAEAEAPKKEPEPAKEAAPAVTAPAATSTADSTATSPAVRRIASESGIDPATVAGTGKAGRVTKGDMLGAIENKAAQPKPTATASAPVATSPEGRTSRKKMTPLRKKIAQRLVEASQQAALLTTFNEVDMSAVMKIRKKYQEAFVAKNEVKLGFMSFFVKAAVKALQEVPAINAQVEGDEIIQNHYYDVGVAVGTEKGLIVPVVRDCDQKGFAEVEQSIINYAKAARSGKITINDLQGGVFTISNGGIYGSMLSTPIVNAPQSGILGLHNITERAVVVNGEIVIRPMMYLALTYDHRLVDGKEAVTFLVKIKEAIEDPTRMLFDV